MQRQDMLKSRVSLSSCRLFHQLCHLRSSCFWRSGSDFFKSFVEGVGVPEESQLLGVFVYEGVESAYGMVSPDANVAR